MDLGNWMVRYYKNQRRYLEHQKLDRLWSRLERRPTSLLLAALPGEMIAPFGYHRKTDGDIPTGDLK